MCWRGWGGRVAGGSWGKEEEETCAGCTLQNEIEDVTKASPPVLRTTRSGTTTAASGDRSTIMVAAADGTKYPHHRDRASARNCETLAYPLQSSFTASDERSRVLKKDRRNVQQVG